MFTKSALPLQITAAVTALMTSFLPFSAAQAQGLFQEQDMDQKNIAAIAVPVGSSYSLLVVEQIPGKRQCWSESGTNPVLIDPLLLNFDFTGSCRRSTDSNGYSMRVSGEDLGLQYLLRIISTGDELILLGTPSDRRKQEVAIGRSFGMANGYLKFSLLPGWKFTRRLYNGKPLGHFYFSGNSTQLLALKPTEEGGPDTDMPDKVVIVPPTDPSTNPTLPGNTTSNNTGNNTSTNGGTNTGTKTPPDVVVGGAIAFRDISMDIYKTEIEQAVATGFIAGYKEDQTFRPEAVLTREQLVSMVLEALKNIPNANINVPTVGMSPYPDVPSNRWSAGKIAWAKSAQIVSGYPDGSFKPEKTVNRAELMAILRKAADFAQTTQGKSLSATRDPFTFSDISGHWAKDTISLMSSYCGVASAYEEQGDRYLPNEGAKRNYAAAATLRMLNCSKK